MCREEAVHQRGVGLVDRSRGIDRRVCRRDAEQHCDISELEVAVDDAHLLRGARRERDGQVGREDALADTTLGGERDDDAAELDGPAARRGARARQRLADALDGLADGGVVGVERQRVAHAGAQRLLEQRERQLLGDEHDAHLRVLAAEPLRLRETGVVGETRTEHDHGGSVAVEGRDQRLDRVGHGRFGRCQLNGQPSPVSLVRLDRRHAVSLRRTHLSPLLPLPIVVPFI